MTNLIPDTPDSLLTRDRTAAALTEAGFPVKARTLATKATRGGRPIYRKFGLRVLYRWDDALAWAEGLAERSISLRWPDRTRAHFFPSRRGVQLTPGLIASSGPEITPALHRQIQSTHFASWQLTGFGREIGDAR